MILIATCGGAPRGLLMASRPCQGGRRGWYHVPWSKVFGLRLEALHEGAHAWQFVFQSGSYSSCHRTSSHVDVLVLPRIESTLVRYLI